eukprot:TRINITY_DN6654_c0_g1_i2.p1 TRINITY_DN6654_c0_g1~~TRINITY_DN6654_c0_g1_i2.p1  ORF type:complete len:144 (-),score=39.63 TRINITY_DN6654_c0_g1_i2:17-448(-)
MKMRLSSFNRSIIFSREAERRRAENAEMERLELIEFRRAMTSASKSDAPTLVFASTHKQKVGETIKPAGVKIIKPKTTTTTTTDTPSSSSSSSSTPASNITTNNKRKESDSEPPPSKKPAVPSGLAGLAAYDSSSDSDSDTDR